MLNKYFLDVIFSFSGYSCALVSDILLQGHLYITQNYFAFYSNVFGYVTKVIFIGTAFFNVLSPKSITDQFQMMMKRNS